MVKTIKMKLDVYIKLKSIADELGMPLTQTIHYLCVKWRSDNA